VPPWEITDSFLAVPPAAAKEPLRDGGGEDDGSPDGATPGERTAESDVTESFPAVDPRPDRRQLPPASLGPGAASFPPTPQSRTDADAFRLFPPVRGDDSRPADNENGQG